MKVFPSSYSAALAAAQKEPRCLIRFYHVQSLFGYDFSMDFTTGVVTNAPVTYAQVADFPTGNTQTVQLEQGQSTIGTFRIQFLDKDGLMSKFMGNPGAGLTASINNTTTTIPASIAGGLVAAYPPRGKLLIESERIVYATLTDSQFTGVGRGVDGTAAASHTAPSSVQNGDQIRPNQGVQIFVGDSSVDFTQYASLAIMQVFERSQPQIGMYEIACQDIQRQMKRIAFLDAAPDTQSATNTLTRQGNPLNLLLQVWTTTSGPTQNGSYDQVDGRGAGIPVRFIAVTSIEALRDSQFQNDVYTFLMREPIDVKRWSEDLLKTLNCYTFVTQSGQLSVKRLTSSGTAVASLTMDTIIGIPQWEAGDRLIANQLSFLYDFGKDTPGVFSTRELFSSDASVAKYDRRPPLTIEAQGVRTANSGAAIAFNRASRFFERFADPPPTLRLDAHYSQLALDIGDVVTVTHSYVPNPRTGGVGLNGAIFEVTDMRPILNPREGAPRVQMTLLHTGMADMPASPVSVRSGPGGAGGVDQIPPGVPTSFTVTTTYRIATDGTFLGVVVASWTAPSDPDLAGFIARVREIGAIPYQFFNLPNVTTFTEPNALPGVSFEAQISAVDFSGNQSSYTSVVTFATPNPPPFTAPLSFTVTTTYRIATDGTLRGVVAASWTPPVNAGVGLAGYTANVRRVGDVAFQRYNFPNVTNIIDENAIPNTNFEAQIAGVDRSGAVGSYTALTSFSTPGAPALTAPLSLTITTSLRTALDGTAKGIVIASWTAPANVGVGIAGYTAQVRRVGDIAFQQYNFPNITNVIDDNALPNTTFEAQVAAVDRSGLTGSYTVLTSFSTPTVATFGAPSSFQATTSYRVAVDGTLFGTVVASWSMPASVQFLTLGGFTARVSRAGDLAGGVNVQVFSFPGSTFHYVEDNALPGTSFEADVAAIDQWNRIGTRSTAITFTTPGSAGIPPTPTGLTATPGPGGVMVTWNAVSYASLAGYQGWRATNSAMTVNSISAIVGLETAHFDGGGLDPATTFYYRLRSITTAGTVSSFSAMAFSTPGVVVSGGLGDGSVLTTSVNSQAITTPKRQLLNALSQTGSLGGTAATRVHTFTHNLGVVPLTTALWNVTAGDGSEGIWAFNTNDTVNSVIVVANPASGTAFQYTVTIQFF